MVQRYLTADLPGTGGAIKQQVDDFVVEELPLYEASGAGEHTLFEIRKEGLSTFQAVRSIAQALGVPPAHVGYAGLKDAHAVTCQHLSVQGVPPETVAALNLPQIQVAWARRHRNKLKVGHLRGNRFRIRIREVEPSVLSVVQAVLGLLARRGVPNFFGPQRFGQRGDSARLGRDLLRCDVSSFVRGFLGGPHPAEAERVQVARAWFDAGQWDEAARLLPYSMADERRALQAFIESHGNPHRACAAVPGRLKGLFLSAYQSELFNRVLEERLESLDRVDRGDLAMKHPGHSIFRVEDGATEQPRADRFEISPTGPIFGFKMMTASGHQGELESAVLAEEELTLSDFRVGHGLSARGERRALRFQVHEPDLWYEDGVVLGFWLPPGCYATTVLAEIMKVPFAPIKGENVDDVAEL